MTVDYTQSELTKWKKGYLVVADDLESAIEILRDIAAMGRKAGSETARNWLLQHGYALEDGGYIPGKGFEDSVRIGPAAQDAGTVTGTSSEGMQTGKTSRGIAEREAHDKPVSQCDGCRAGLPKYNDRHWQRYADGKEYPEMYCTARRYV